LLADNANAAERDRPMSLAKQAAFNAPGTKTSYVQVLFAQALASHRNGNLVEAEAAYRKVVKKCPNHFDAWHMLGVCELASGNYEAAVRPLKRALLLDPQSAGAHSDLGITLKALEKYDDALACFDQAITLKPDFADALYNRGNLLIELSRFDDAVANCDKAIAINPQHVQAWKSRGNALHGLARFTDALASYDQAIAIAPDDAGAWASRGEMLRCLGRLDDAFASSERALSINAEIPEAWLVRAVILFTKGKVIDSQANCQRALAIRPDYAKAFTQLGQCHMQQADAEAGVACFDRALAIKPDDETTLSSRIFALDFCRDGDFACHQAARSEWWRQIGSKIAAKHPPRHDNDRDPNRRIVLGYVSAEFRQRSAAYSFRPVLENHDKARFEVICYSSSPTEDAVTDSFRQVADRWHDVLQWSDDRLADCIRTDKVDILIDLSGHTDGNRLRTFARKPAPVQVTAWGHATGTGRVALLGAAGGIERLRDLRCLQQGEQALRCRDRRLGANSAVRRHITIADQGSPDQRCRRPKLAAGKLRSPWHSAGSDIPDGINLSRGASRSLPAHRHLPRSDSSWRGRLHLGSPAYGGAGRDQAR
jgi:tetratricopeptide (TPR) repeat protein